MISFVATILKLALALLLSVNNNPAVSDAQRQQAISVAVQAIQLATQTLGQNSNSTMQNDQPSNSSVTSSVPSATSSVPSNPLSFSIVRDATNLSIPTNSTAILLDEYDMSAPVGTGFTLDTITLNIGSQVTTGGLSVANLRVYLANQNQWFGATQTSVYPNQSYTYSGSVSVPAGTTERIEIFGDTVGATSGTYASPFSIGIGTTGITASGATIATTGSTAGANIFVSAAAASLQVPTASITAYPTTFALGQSTQLTWSSTDATSCVMHGAMGNVSDISSSSGSVTRTPTITGAITYTIACQGPGGTSNPASVTVTVTPTSGSGTASTSTHGLTVSTSNNLASGYLPAGSTDAIVGSYVLNNLSPENISLSNIEVAFGTSAQGTFQNVGLFVHGALFGSIQNSLDAYGGYTFAGTPFITPTNSQVVIEVHADISPSSTIGTQIGTRWGGCLGIGSMTGSTYHCPVANGQVMTISQ